LLILALVILAVVMGSCSASQRAANKIRRAEKLIAKAEQLGATWETDTVFREVKVTVPKTEFDTVVKVTTWRDTITVVKDRLVTRVVVTPETKSVYIASKCDTVTIIKEVPVEVNKSLHTGATMWQKLGRSAIWLIIGLIVGFALCWFGKLLRIIP